MRRLVCRRSLSWRLVSRFSGLLLLVMIALTVAFGTFLATQPLGPRAVDAAMPAIIAESIAKDGARLVLRPSPALLRASQGSPGLWFVAVDAQGRTVSYGATPPELQSLAARLAQFPAIEIRSPQALELTSKVVEVKVGTEPVRVFYGGKIEQKPNLAILFAFLVFFYAPTLVVTLILAFVAIPMVVRRSLRGLRRTAELAAAINLDSLPERLPTHEMPMEVQPLVKAVNLALGRIEAAMRSRQRFLADAAHELRTPIAILQTRLEALPAGPQRAALLGDAARLAAVAEQLLDMQRYAAIHEPEQADLAALCERVVADLAPAAIAAGYGLELVRAEGSSMVFGDVTSMGRAVTNLVTNAIQHGGGQGMITVSVSEGGVVEVADQGPGIDADTRERIFEPFYRVRPRSNGAGLGLALVRQIARLHGGDIVVTPQPSGARLRLSLGGLKPGAPLRR
jgi:signal transduction histidine kinase